MKSLLLFLCGLICTYSLSGQNTWAQSLPFSFIQPGFCGLYQDADAYYLHTNQHVVQFDYQGVISGYLQFPNVADIHTGVIKKINSATGLPYFITIRRNATADASYTLRAFLPGTGFVQDQTFSDSLGVFSGERPVLSALPDGDFLVTGRQFYRKIRYTPDVGFEEIWKKPLNRETAAVCVSDSRIYIGDRNGGVLALDLNGTFLWGQNFGFSLRAVSVAPGGLVLCGAKTGNKSLIIRTDDNGTELWRQETDDRDYHHAISTTDGFVAAGTSNSSEIVLTSFDHTGAQTWRSTFLPGIGLRVLQDPDGGFILLAYGTNSSINGARLIKTNNLGQTAPLKKSVIGGRRIQNNHIETMLRPRSTLFADGGDPTIIYASDTASVAHAVSPWLGALDGEQKLYLAAELNNLSTSDFQTGPIGSEPKDFHRVWSVTRKDVQRLRLDFEQDQTLDERIPHDILTWPAKGNPHFQLNLDFTAVSTPSELFAAPFVDANGDGAYNVYQGDYPLIKGDQTAWWIMNDLVNHAESQGSPLEIQVAFRVYTQDCPGNGTIAQSLFAEFEAVNFSSRNYTDAYWGLYTNFDLGCFEDDYLGSLPEADACFAYNYAAEDTNCGLGADYLNKAPLQTLTYLNRDMGSNIAIYNSTVGQPPNACTNPSTSHEFYRYLQAQWRDGAQLTRGGWGYNPNQTDTTRFLFPDNPAEAAGWSMCTADLGAVDVRSLSAAGPFQLAAGDTTRLQFVVTFLEDLDDSPCPDLHPVLIPTLQQLKAWHEDGTLDTRPALPSVVLLPPGETVSFNAEIPAGAAYQWSNGAETPTLDVDSTGLYSVTVTASTGCEYVESVLVQSQSHTQDKHSPAYWRLYPNPARDFVWLDCMPECRENDLRISLYNALGQIIIDRPADFNRLDCTQLTPGLYRLLLQDKNGRMVTQRTLAIVR